MTAPSHVRTVEAMTITTGPNPTRTDGPAFQPEQFRRDDVAAAVFSSWVVIGLFVDGWAHNADKPEDFFTPWHLLLYSGFVTGAVYFGIVRLSRARRGEPVPPDDRLVLAGFALFAVAGVGDGVWHTIFGVEENIEALLSPTHLALMIGGLFLVTSPVRASLGRSSPDRTLAALAPSIVGITLAVSVVAFFTQFASAMHLSGTDLSGAAALDEDHQVAAVVAILLTNALLLAALHWTRQSWRHIPAGTFTIVFGATAVLMSGLDGFETIVLALPTAAAGAVADTLIAKRAGPVTVAIGVPIAWWTAWFGTYHAAYTLDWPPELWTGTIVLAALTGAGLQLLTAAPTPSRSTRRVAFARRINPRR